MHGRLAALPAADGCLDLGQIEKIEHAGLIELEGKSSIGKIASLRDFLRSSIQHADAILGERFWQGEDVVQLVHSRAWVVEQLLLLAWKKLVPFNDNVSLVAVGGYGRGELHPNSDIDLLILLDDSIEHAFLKNEIEAFVQLLWDAGFYLGHSVRSVSECAEDAASDVVTTTAFMESRLLAGSMDLLDRMLEATSAEKIWSGRDFFEAKYEEQKQRHERFHETAYNLEPNIKEGPGGLRDIQMISWVAHRHFGSETLHGLVEHGFLNPAEHNDLVGGQHFLWRVRYALHLLAGRAEDRLLFDFQRQIAERFGFVDSSTSLAVEQFMQLYYRTVMLLERLNESLLQLFQEALLSSGREDVVVLNDDFQAHNGFVELRSETVFEQKPVALMELFVLLAREESLAGVTASTIRSIREHLYLVDDDFRCDPEVNACFLELLRQPEGVYTQLRRMNRYGLLAALIPAFGNIVGRMQYDLFHVYTVDQHTLFVVRNLRRFAYGKYKERFPYARSVFKRIAKPELLYLAAIFHDIAKGRGGDHSELGAVDAEAFCAMLDIEPWEREMVSWLVRYHLIMSQTSQRKDLSDPKNIQAFAEIVGNTRNLDHLYLLTVADIAGTSPKLWNNWKNKLLWDLYLAAGDALRRGLENPIKRATRIRETRASAQSRLMRRGGNAKSINRLWETLPEYAFWRLSPGQLEWTTECVAEKPITERCIAIRPVQPHGVSDLLVCVPDYKGLFASITSVLDEMGLDVMSARVLTTTDDRSFDLFQLMDSQGDVLNAADEAELIRRLKAATSGREARSPVKRTIPRRLRHFTPDTKIRFQKDPDGAGTVLHIKCTDRPGLLSRVAEAIFKTGSQVHNARIATFGERVEDTFLISGETGKPLSKEAREGLAEAIKESIENG
ncbi:MAG: [protein-PII] uridylyltransferase [Xanthomonadales bacterium]|nr:[protein-PII] uridylyltransferase [Gammaproteobacteria bacterium]NND58337.1 [protein-PII] uridylyltransferase [Xanthomonadales bacterium]